MALPCSGPLLIQVKSKMFIQSIFGHQSILPGGCECQLSNSSIVCNMVLYLWIKVVQLSANLEKFRVRWNSSAVDDSQHQCCIADEYGVAGEKYKYTFNCSKKYWYHKFIRIIYDVNFIMNTWPAATYCSWRLLLSISLSHGTCGLRRTWDISAFSFFVPYIVWDIASDKVLQYRCWTDSNSKPQNFRISISINADCIAGWKNLSCIKHAGW